MMPFHNMSKHDRFISMPSGILLVLLPLTSYAQNPDAVTPNLNTTIPQTQADTARLDTLDSFVDLRNAILQDIKAVNQQIGTSQSDAEKQGLKLQLDKLESDLRDITKNFGNTSEQLVTRSGSDCRFHGRTG